MDTYTDEADGRLEKNSEGKLAMTTVVLRPKVKYSPRTVPTHEEDAALHHDAHVECFIANSVRTDVKVIPSFV